MTKNLINFIRDLIFLTLPTAGQQLASPLLGVAQLIGQRQTKLAFSPVPFILLLAITSLALHEELYLNSFEWQASIFFISITNRVCLNRSSFYGALRGVLLRGSEVSASLLRNQALRYSSYSTNSSVAAPFNGVTKAVKIYANADIQKFKILTENKATAGVYRWTNLINGKSYIGSSVNLERRMRNYFSITYLKTHLPRTSSTIYKALIKYGYSAFSL